MSTSFSESFDWQNSGPPEDAMNLYRRCNFMFVWDAQEDTDFGSLILKCEDIFNTMRNKDCIPSRIGSVATERGNASYELQPQPPGTSVVNYTILFDQTIDTAKGWNVHWALYASGAVPSPDEDSNHNLLSIGDFGTLAFGNTTNDTMTGYLTTPLTILAHHPMVPGPQDGAYLSLLNHVE
ncbi:hypothetical protein LTS18_005927, partial [Coniosporium uncinatum]